MQCPGVVDAPVVNDEEQRADQDVDRQAYVPPVVMVLGLWSDEHRHRSTERGA